MIIKVNHFKTHVIFDKGISQEAIAKCKYMRICVLHTLKDT